MAEAPFVYAHRVELPYMEGAAPYLEEESEGPVRTGPCSRCRKM